MKKVKTNQLEVLNRVIAEKSDDAEWKRFLYITGGYKALYNLYEGIQKILTTNDVEIKGLADYQDINTTIKIRLQDWE